MSQDEQPTRPRRKSWVAPGFDHVDNPCDAICATRGGNHGRCSDIWSYAAVSEDGLAALTLDVFSDQLDGKPWGPGKHAGGFHGRDMSLHVAYPCEGSGLYSGSDAADCFALGRPCLHITWSSSLAADEFWKAHGDTTQLQQGIGFWLALEEKLVEIDTKWGRPYGVTPEVIADRGRRDAWLANAKKLPAHLYSSILPGEYGGSTVTIGDVHRWLMEALK